MGANESMLRSGALLQVMDRRGKLTKEQLSYIETDDFRKFWGKYGNEIKERACDLYGLELLNLVNEKSVSRTAEVVKEIHSYACVNYRVPHIYEAVQKMVESGNINYLKLFRYLAGYVTFDLIISSIISGNIAMFDMLKEPVSRIPGKKGITDPLREALKRGRVITLTDMTPEELGVYAIFSALSLLALSTNTREYDDRKYILTDIMSYVQSIDLLTKREANNYLNDMLDNMETGNLYLWSQELVQRAGKIFMLPPVSEQKQKESYKNNKDLLKIYTRIGIVKQYF